MKSGFKSVKKIELAFSSCVADKRDPLVSETQQSMAALLD